MSTNLGKIDAPSAARATAPGWRDPRLWVGIALVAGSVLLGARLLADSDDAVEVWAAARDLQPGQEITADDLQVVEVSFADGEAGAGYLRADVELPEEAVLDRAIGSGELLPGAALGPGSDGSLEVALWAPAVSVPDAVRPGSTVDVWVIDESGEGGREPALAGVRVVAVPRGESGLGPGGDRQVVVAVPSDAEPRLGAVLSAAHAGRVVLTRRG